MWEEETERRKDPKATQGDGNMKHEGNLVQVITETPGDTAVNMGSLRRGDRIFKWPRRRAKSCPTLAIEDPFMEL